jgi:hypothetical protein
MAKQSNGGGSCLAAAVLVASIVLFVLALILFLYGVEASSIQDTLMASGAFLASVFMGILGLMAAMTARYLDS